MTNNFEEFKNYIPFPFWDMDHNHWNQYLNGLKDKDRSVLSYYPFKWAYVPPHNADTAVEFLHDIGVGKNKIAPDAVEKIFNSMPTFEELIENNSVQWLDDTVDEFPPPGFRMTPEWEKMTGVLFSWPIYYPPLWETFRQVIAAFDHVKIFLRIPEGYPGAAVLGWLEANGVDLDTVRPIPGPLGDIWAKDYSPLYGINSYTGEPVAHKFGFAAYGDLYKNCFKASVEKDEKFVWSEGYKVYSSDIIMDGGYLQTTDGDGTYILTRRMLVDNAKIPNLNAKLEHWLGADKMIFVDEQPGDTLGHINHFRFISPGKALCGKPDQEGTPLFNYLSKIRSTIIKSGYEVIDIPCPEGFGRTLPNGDFADPILYANILMMNDRVIVPTYDFSGIEKYNDQAMEGYHKAFPGHKIIPVDVSVLATGGGAIYCSTREIPAVV